jgi:Cell wall-active antibiotics response LiaF, C-terminal
MANKVFTVNLSERLNGTTAAKVDINAGTGNLTIDKVAVGEQVLASGTLQYLEKQGLPTHTVDASNGQATLTLKRGEGGTGRSWFSLPWKACVGAYDWQIHLNPAVSSDITAHSDGGNVKLDLADMAITRVMADTGGGNMEVLLPNNAANLSVSARTGGGDVTVDLGNGITGNNAVDANSGAGNVAVHLPGGIAARIHATSGLGKVIVEPQFSRISGNTYQSPDYDAAPDKIEITVNSGAGNVSVDTK